MMEKIPDMELSAEELYNRYKTDENIETDASHKESRVGKSSGKAFEMYVAKGNDMIVGSHWHDCIEILFVKKGAFFANINGCYYRLHKDDILFISPGDMHGTSCVPDTNVTVYVIKFVLDVIDEGRAYGEATKIFLPFYNKQHTVKNHIDENNPYYNEIGDIFRKLVREFLNKQDVYQFYIKTLLDELICLFVRMKIIYIEEDENTSSVSDRLEILLKYLNENWKSVLKREDAAKIVFMSEGYFSYYFKRNMGVTYKEYIDNLKLEKIEEHMRTNSVSIKQIALESGFKSPSNFIRLYKSVKGCTPGKMRKNTES